MSAAMGRRPRATAAISSCLLMLAVLSGCTDDSPERVPGTSWAPAPVAVGELSVLAHADADGFRLHTSSGEKDFIPGVNLGSTVPLRQPGEIGSIPPEQYAQWLQQMGDLGVRSVRIYTLPPPGFYAELAAYNRDHPAAPIYLMQGVYLPDESYVEAGATLYDPAVDDAFAQELRDVSDAVHGDLTREAAPGRAGGTYDVDVSEWLVGWVVGVEWDPAGVVRTDKRHADAPSVDGTYFAATTEASPTERWLARHLDSLAAAEVARGTSMPIALANWPTVDPLEHPDEPLPYEDLVSVDATHVLPTEAWPGGTFASFHAYPYYPDFQRYEAGIQDEEWNGRPDPFAGYLVSLRDHFAPYMPLLITEVGVPTSLGSAHTGPLGRDQGNHGEAEAMAINADLMRMLAEKGIGAGYVFAWQDEWFKRTWNTQEHQVDERRQLWHDPLTNEQWFGLIATDADPLVDAAVEALPETGPLEYVHIWADASWVHLEITGRESVPPSVEVDADVVPGPEAADYRLVVEPGAGTAQSWVRRELDPIRLDTREVPYRPDAAEPWHPFQLLVNRAQTRPIPQEAEFSDVGQLVEGSWDPSAEEFDSLATWQVDEERRTIRVRWAWSMLGLADPSSRTALGEGIPAEMVKIPGITFAVQTGGERLDLELVWPEWNHTTYTTRPKAGLAVLEKAYSDLAP
ncbi:hypothetical protein EXE58_13980 [Nocardioides seonyuensis]|uniref:Uncharacterized protein n=1 Tax=Nocardioides seonyuensis TaxID=2518371 RepID=A0A4P7IGI7_9ACTN|nr:hypothetical protein [Nocardioides seonyuensis]QBX56464.1 hypothetical protein EXE58_13980 [Nocardioides seonyuensis]